MACNNYLVNHLILISDIFYFKGSHIISYSKIMWGCLNCYSAQLYLCLSEKEVERKINVGDSNPELHGGDTYLIQQNVNIIDLPEPSTLQICARVLFP